MRFEENEKGNNNSITRQLREKRAKEHKRRP